MEWSRTFCTCSRLRATMRLRGSDWDGFIRPTKGLASPAELPNLTEALLRAGVSAATVHKILGKTCYVFCAAPPKLCGLVAAKHVNHAHHRRDFRSPRRAFFV